MSNRFLCLLVCGVLVALGCDEKNVSGDNGYVPGEQTTLDSVDGLYSIDSVRTDVPITFYIRITNNTGDTINGFTHGFKVYSPDGVHWNTTIGVDAGGITKSMIDQGIFISSKSVSGSAADTIGFGGFKITGSGILDGFDALAFGVQIGPISASYHGRRICIDSSFFPPGGEWLWSTSGDWVHPDWDGVRCFRIVNPSALAVRGKSPNPGR